MSALAHTCFRVGPVRSTCAACEATPSEGPLSLNDYQSEMRRTYRVAKLTNHALGLSGETAELADEVISIAGQALRANIAAGHIADMVKKQEFHARPADREAILKELGDVLWYVSAVALDYGFTLEDVGRANVAKLLARYPGGFVPGGGNR